MRLHNVRSGMFSHWVEMGALVELGYPQSRLVAAQLSKLQVEASSSQS